jgi:hypothetical protein
MNSRPHRSIASSLIRALPLCLGLIIAPISPASSDQAATLAEEITHDYNSTQIAALIAAAAGKVETGTRLHSSHCNTRSMSAMASLPRSCASSTEPT